MALNPDQVPMAFPRRLSSKEAEIRARLPGTSSAAAIPCTARAAMSCPVPGAKLPADQVPESKHKKSSVAYVALTSMPNRRDWQKFSEFYQDPAGEIFHTYSSYARGPEELIGTLMILDRAPKGRNETTIMDFVRRHDEYAAAERRACGEASKS